MQYMEKMLTVKTKVILLMSFTEFTAKTSINPLMAISVVVMVYMGKMKTPEILHSSAAIAMAFSH